jgi:hypothetical protein
MEINSNKMKFRSMSNHDNGKLIIAKTIFNNYRNQWNPKIIMKEALKTEISEVCLRSKENNKLFDTTDIDELPDELKLKIDESKKKYNTLFINKAFSDLEQFHNKLPYSKKFNFSSYDKIYFMYKLRDNPELVINSGYTKYLFSLNIDNDTGGDSLYTLTITNNETGEIGVYEKEVGRFD